jgi:hypothetical protein
MGLFFGLYCPGYQIRRGNGVGISQHNTDRPLDTALEDRMVVFKRIGVDAANAGVVAFSGGQRDQTTPDIFFQDAYEWPRTTRQCLSSGAEIDRRNRPPPFPPRYVTITLREALHLRRSQQRS